jgi:hypothetical protein
MCEGGIERRKRNREGGIGEAEYDWGSVIGGSDRRKCDRRKRDTIGGIGKAEYRSESTIGGIGKLGRNGALFVKREFGILVIRFWDVFFSEAI